jgi:hypothetical protein
MQGGKTDRGARGRRRLWKNPALITALILLIPLLGNRFVNGWNWGLPAFFLLGTLVFGAGLTYELVTRNVESVAYRAAVVVALGAALVLLWMNRVQAADGVNPSALMYFAVPVVGIIGAAVARLQTAGMARALFATALAQALILAMMLITWNSGASSSASAAARGFGLNAFVLILFAGSALLFRKAARAA